MRHCPVRSKENSKEYRKSRCKEQTILLGLRQSTQEKGPPAPPPPEGQCQGKLVLKKLCVLQQPGAGCKCYFEKNICGKCRRSYPYQSGLKATSHTALYRDTQLFSVLMSELPYQKLSSFKARIIFHLPRVAKPEVSIHQVLNNLFLNI